MQQKGGFSVVSIIAIIVILYFAGYILDRFETKDYEKEIIGYIEEGEYYFAVDRYDYYSDMTVTGYSKKVEKAALDVACYLLICEELDKTNPDFEYIDACFDEMTGQYKKYKTFKKDVKELKAYVKKVKKESSD